jgi:hypothetical protein
MPPRTRTAAAAAAAGSSPAKAGAASPPAPPAHASAPAPANDAGAAATPPALPLAQRRWVAVAALLLLPSPLFLALFLRIEDAAVKRLILARAPAARASSAPN